MNERNYKGYTIAMTCIHRKYRKPGLKAISWLVALNDDLIGNNIESLKEAKLIADWHSNLVP